MMGFPSTFTESLLCEYEKQTDRIVYTKLRAAAYEAIRQGNIELYCILLDASNPQRVINEAKKAGYEITLELPDYQFTCDENIARATLDVDKIKIIVKKTIIEV